MALFRPEVEAYRHRRLQGTVLLKQPWHLELMLVLLLAAAGIGLGLAAMSHYTRYEVVPGRIVRVAHRDEATTGATAGTGDAAAAVVDLGEADLYVPAHVVAHLSHARPVLLEAAVGPGAAPAPIVGRLLGVSEIASTVVPLTASEPVYRVRLELRPASGSASPAPGLRPGMSVQGRIASERLSYLQLMLNPRRPAGGPNSHAR